ncbi:MAG: PAS domain-containing protein [Clostridia bacterium]|nr:PAS domain-containing protein [Clostridia bacterium]
MLKRTKNKIIIIFFIIGILVIGAICLVFLNMLNNASRAVETNGLSSSEEVIQLFTDLKQKAQIILAVAGAAFALVVGITAFIISKFIIRPVDNTVSLMTSELKDKLSEVSKQRNQMETILLHMTDGIIAFDMEGNIILINPEAKRLLKMSPEDKSFDDIFKNSGVDINMEKIIYLENWTSTEERVKVEDTYIHIFFAPFKNENDTPAGVIAVIQDITEHVTLDNMRKEFVADVSHELKTPITSIMGYADTLLEAEYDKETQGKFLNVIATEARRMAKLVTDLLTLSRYDNARNRIKREAFDLGELVKRAQDKLAIEAMKKEHKVSCFVTADVPPVYADKDDIERVVLNILSNSIKYTPNGGDIKIYVGFVYNDAYIKIIDNGIGIPEEDLSKIFERFYRVDKARTREMGGTGLGLSIAKEILDKNGGSIDIKSVVGEGTEVVIRIPTKE